LSATLAAIDENTHLYYLASDHIFGAAILGLLKEGILGAVKDTAYDTKETS